MELSVIYDIILLFNIFNINIKIKKNPFFILPFYSINLYRNLC